MVRIRSKPAKAPAALSSQSTMPVRKRKYEESKQQTSNNVSPRSSKRVRATILPYQSPASLDALITPAARQKKAVVNQETPKKKADVAQRKQKKPEKPVKRLQKKGGVTKPQVKAPVRRKLLATPEPAAAASAKNKKTDVKSKIKNAKQTLVKVQVTKKKVVSPRKKGSKAVDVDVLVDSTPKKRKKGQNKDSSIPAADHQDANAGKRQKKDKKKPRKGNLNPKPHLTNYEKNPTFETKLEIPFISTLTQSRLLIRAVKLNDMKLLKKLIHDEPQKIFTTSMCSGIKVQDDVFDFICKTENKEAFKLLHKIPEKTLEKFGSPPSLLLTSESTGRGNTRMFGHALRQVNVGRGGKEGNDAFLYDRGLYNYGKTSTVNCLNEYMKKGVSLNFIEFLMKELDIQWDPMQVHTPLRTGQHEICGKMITNGVERGGYGFNFLHQETLTKKTSASLTPFKPVSVVKKCTYSPRFSPLHCAAINPNAEVLIALLRSMPDYNLADGDGWTVGHYAAVCSGDGPLKYLLQFGISTQATTSTKRGGDGYTLLHAAVSAGRAHNVKVILDHEKASKATTIPDEANEEDVGGKEKQKDLLQNDILYKLNTQGLNVLQMACQLGYLEIVKLLLEAEVDANRPTPAKYDRVTPLMISAQYGHLAIVKLLIDYGAKVEAKDKRGRTAATHAAMHGQTHILSYLLRLGANHLALDSSGNSLLHYSAAYGWFFETMLLLEAGCPPNATNHWKMTPVAIAFMKGHIGLVEVLMKQEGVDVNARVNDSTGETLLLGACSVCSPELEKLKFLIEKLQADPKCEDFEGNNALHYVAVKTIGMFVPDYQKKLKSTNICINYLIQQGCDPFKSNAQGTSSILLAATQKNFPYIQNILQLSMKLPFENEQDQGNTLLHYLTDSLQSDAAHDVFTKLVKDASSLTVLKEMAKTYNKEGVTPFLSLLQKHTSLELQDGVKSKRLLQMAETFLTKLGVDVDAKVQNKTQESALHLIVKTDYAGEIIPLLMKFKPNLDPQDSEGQTPLLVAVLGGLHEVAEKLINAGANVKFKVKKQDNIGLALLAAMQETKSFYLIPKLVGKGADPAEVHPKTKNSLLHYIARKPMLPKALEALNAVLEAGVNPDLANCDGRTALHLVLNARGSETDVFYDIEDALISAGANLAKKDQRGRIPLHYAFVKIGDPTNKTFFDPIELVSSIVTSMKTSGAASEIHSMDVFGSTPLHYSAYRGSTICCSYLMQAIPKSGIDLSDMNGNTPFALAVRNCHEGCALNFYQKDADYLRIINNNIKTADLKTEETQQPSSSAPTQEAWEWEHLVKENAEREKLLEEQEKYPILEQVVKHNWQGLLYLMIGRLETSGVGFSTGIATALKTNRLKLALKLAWRVKSQKELRLQSGTLFHNLAKMYTGSDDELVTKICQSFRKNGLDPNALDEFGSQAIIYALANQQITLGDIIFYDIKDQVGSLATMKPDLFGRTPFSSLFWNMKLETPLQPQTENWGSQLVAAGANPNQLCEYPISLSSFPGIRFDRKLTDIIPSNAPRYPPLIIAVLTKSCKTIKWLLNLRSGPFSTNLNAQDSEGRTALMHAVRLNDFRVLKTLLDPVTYDYTKDTDGSKSIQIKSTTVDVSIRDNKGWTVMDYLVCSTGSYWQYKNVTPIIQVLQKIGGAMTITSGDGLQPIDRALKHKRQDIVETLNKFIPSKQKQASASARYYPSFSTAYSQDIILTPIQDYNTSASRMAEKIMEKAKEKMLKEGLEDVLKPKPDDLCGLAEKDNSELIVDEKQNIPYDCIMTKVDLNYGSHGLYNFYKMQLVKELTGKKMIILFTQWGRVGDTGQYQRTPFATEEEAVKEFTKIFKSKSGNAWEDVQNFNPIPSKYRVIKKDLRTVKYSTQVNVDFGDLEKHGRNNNSTLPGRVLYLMRNLALVHQDAGAAYRSSRRHYLSSYATHPDYCNLPLLPLDVLEKAENILKEISVQMEKDEKMKNDRKVTYTEQEKLEAMNKIVTLSEEFYSLIPVYGYATEKLEPIFQYEDLRTKIEAIDRLMHLELAKLMILAAQLHQANINPFEYIYRCLGTQIHLLDSLNPTEKEEIEIILQYIHNTSENKVKVTAIYRIEKPSEDLKLDRSNIQNRQLLWHGTSSANMLSILQQGLQVAPMGAQISGHLFGKGIYLADMFAKSQHYCRTVAVHGKTRQYILLAEAALGKVYEVKLEDACDKPMPKGYDSLITSDSRYLPDPEYTVIWKGRTVTVGPQTERLFKEDEYPGLDYNEYIVYNSDQVAMRYLIEFE